MNDDFQFPDSARRAFDDYPQIEASDAFNRAIFAQLEMQKTRRRATFLGRVEEFLGLDLWQFAASGMLGAFLPALILGALYFSNRDAAPAPPSPIGPLPTPFRTMGPFYAREWEFEGGFSANKPAHQPQNKKSGISGKEISCVDSTSHWA